MTYPNITASADPDALVQAPIGTVLIRYPNISGALVTVSVADYPRGGGVVSPSPTLNRYAECGGCGELYGSIERGIKEDDVRKWAQKHAETCLALPADDQGLDYATLAHEHVLQAVEALVHWHTPATADLYVRIAEVYARIAGC
jgi:hypothetical protein